MLVYLDSVICIYAVEGAPSFQLRARTRLAAVRAAGDQPAISDLTWLECRVKPVRLGDATALADMEAFLTGSDVVRVPLPTAVYERACRIRASHNYKLADALHKDLAADPAYAKVLADLRQRLRAWRQETNDPWLILERWPR